MPRVRQIARYASETEEIQRGVLRHLVSQAAQTEWGKAHGYDNIKSYEDFAAQVPVSTLTACATARKMCFGKEA